MCGLSVAPCIFCEEVRRKQRTTLTITLFLQDAPESSSPVDDADGVAGECGRLQHRRGGGRRPRQASDADVLHVGPVRSQLPTHPQAATLRRRTHPSEQHPSLSGPGG